MKNKIDLKKYLIVSFISLISLTFIFTLIYKYETKLYRDVVNQKIEMIIENIYKENPNIDKTTIINILNNNHSEKTNFLREYGIDINKESIIQINNKNEKIFTIINVIYIMLSFLILLSIFIIYLTKKDKKIKEITQLIEEINKKNYKVGLDNTEDELSILRNELYKTTIHLKESAETSIKDKIELKNSLEDISHQLKTPLTGIMISLDNLIETNNMDEITRNNFLLKIKREITNINSLVSSILNLSKLDTNTIKFNNDNYKVIDLINESVDKVSLLSDLKNINIKIYGSKNIKIHCDAFWQIEALTNILKNALEHSEKESIVNVFFEENKIYTKIIIKSNSIIDAKDLPHIFERFYKGKNSSVNSVGIGLALAKTIIEKNNGRISVNSNKKEGTTFEIKYFKD